MTPGMRRFLTVLLVVGVMAGLLIAAGTARNHGCLPWKTAVTTGGGVFSESDRGHTYCR